MRRRFFVAAAGAALLSFASTASAAVSAPGVTTGGAAQVTQTSATLTGKVNPHGLRTTYYFLIGVKAGQYTSGTGPTDAGAGTKAVAAAAPETGLTPATVYHYRLVASNAKGEVRGADRTFRTKPQPLAFQFGAGPNPVSYGGTVTLLGQLTGTGSAGRTVKVQAKSFPYTADWADVSSTLVTAADGKFAASVPNILVNTQFRAVTTSPPIVASAPVIVASMVRVSLRTSRTSVAYRHKLRFSGSVTPPEPGSLYVLQRRSRGQWRNVKGGVVLPSSSTSSRFAKTLRIYHAGHYRVFVGVNNQNTSGLSREVVIRFKKHRKHRR